MRVYGWIHLNKNMPASTHTHTFPQAHIHKQYEHASEKDHNFVLVMAAPMLTVLLRGCHTFLHEYNPEKCVNLQK